MLPVTSPPRSGGSSQLKRSNSRIHRRIIARLWSKYGLVVSLVCAMAVWIWGTLRSHTVLVQSTHEKHQFHKKKEKIMALPKRYYNTVDTVLHRPDEQPQAAMFDQGWRLPSAFEAVLERARSMQQKCTKLSSRGLDLSTSTWVRNETFASLPSLGIIEALETWKETPDHPEADEMLIDVEDTPDNWQCQLPPETECDETMLTVIFMAYNPDRLRDLLQQVKVFLYDTQWKTLVAEVVLVWNGDRPVDESKMGQELLNLGKTLPFRVVYPLRRGLENDLMNRYHPSVVRVEQTKAILYYDDDGPFYSFEAVQSGFELWKRHARAQMGAMSRNFVDSQRQKGELVRLRTENPHLARDKFFISHCTNVDDHVEYDYHYFANFDAHMALPSGSMLHVNYLCFLWHPVLEPIRKFVRAHPVHPDDVTVSMIVSQLAGQSPRVYSRRLNKPNEKDIQLYQKLLQKSQETPRRLDDESGNDYFTELDHGIVPLSESQRFRSLMFNIDWDAYSKGDPRLEELKKFWAELRTQAVNSLVRYFGSITGGSIGWCEGTPFYNEKKAGKCDPIMAKQGWLPWMDSDGSPKQTCP